MNAEESVNGNVCDHQNSRQRVGRAQCQLPPLPFRAIRSIMNAPDVLIDTHIRLVELDATFPLRKAVLRPWLTPGEARATWADAAEHFQVGPITDGRVVSTAGSQLVRATCRARVLTYV